MIRRYPHLLPQVSFSILFELSLKPRHGYELMKQVESDSRNRFKLGPGALYGTIKQLLEDGLIEEMSAKSTGNRRRYYRLTKKGRNTLAADVEHYKHTVDLARSRKIIDNPSQANYA